MTRRIVKAPSSPDKGAEEIKKGQLLGVKAPPYYKKEYLYEVTGCGDKVVRADLYGSPKIKKSWTREELDLLIEMNVVRMVGDEERPAKSET